MNPGMYLYEKAVDSYFQLDVKGKNSNPTIPSNAKHLLR